MLRAAISALVTFMALFMIIFIEATGRTILNVNSASGQTTPLA